MKPVSMEFMKNLTQIQLYDIFRKDLKMPDDRAQNLVSTINEAFNDHSEQERTDLATKVFVKDEVQSVKDQIRGLEVSMTRQIFLANLIQFLAVVGAVLAIYAFLRK
jgi:hypothetical protein